jgi:ribosomal RNA-processing protein 12
MIAGTVIALAHILYSFTEALSDKFVFDVFDATSMLLHAEAPEIIRSVLQLVKIALSVLPARKIEPHIATILKNLIDWTRSHPKHLRKESRHFFERLLRKLGFAKISPHVPEETKKVLRNIRKTKERKKKRREADKKKATEDGMDARDPQKAEAKKKKLTFEQTLDLSDLDTSDEEGDEENGMEEGSSKATKSKQRHKDVKMKAGGDDYEDDGDLVEEDEDEDEDEEMMTDDEEEEEDLPTGKRQRVDDDNDDDDDDPADLMDPILASREKALPAKKKRKSDVGKIVFNAEGKLVIEDEDEPAQSLTSTLAAPQSEVDLDRMLEDENDDDDEEGEAEGGTKTVAAKKKAATSGLAARGRSAMYERMMARRQKLDEQRRKKSKPVVHTGAQFKGKGAGDVKRGGVDPFAYIPLDPSRIKKGKSKAVGQFNGIVGAAKKGSHDGAAKFIHRRPKH